MIGIVRVALARPLTFIVMAILIAIVGILAAVRTPVDIFPDIRVPVIATVRCVISVSMPSRTIGPTLA